MEASYLFGIPGERISVLVHPESIVHSMVKYTDGAIWHNYPGPICGLQYNMR